MKDRLSYLKNVVLDSLVRTDVEIPGLIEGDLDLTEYIYESIQYINFVVNIEETLSCELPDELIVYDNFHSLNGFVNMLAELLYVQE